MARNSKLSTKNKPGRKPTPTEGKGRVRRGRPKVCQFCAAHSEWVDYKDINVLRRFVNDRGRIRGRGATGTCSQHQRDVAVAIKTARELALLPYTVRTLAPGAGDRRGGPRRDAALPQPQPRQPCPRPRQPRRRSRQPNLSPPARTPGPETPTHPKTCEGASAVRVGGGHCAGLAGPDRIPLVSPAQPPGERSARRGG